MGSPGGGGGLHNWLPDLQGGDNGEYYHLNKLHHGQLASVIGVTGFESYLTDIFGTNLTLGTDGAAETTLTMHSDEASKYFTITEAGDLVTLQSFGASNNINITSAGYLAFNTAAGTHEYHDLGGSVYWRDIDASDAVRASLAVDATPVFTLGADGIGDTRIIMLSDLAGAYLAISNYGTGAHFRAYGAANELLFTSEYYIRLQTGPGDNIDLQAGGLFNFQDQDASDTLRASLNSGTAVWYWQPTATAVASAGQMAQSAPYRTAVQHTAGAVSRLTGTVHQQESVEAGDTIATSDTEDTFASSEWPVPANFWIDGGVNAKGMQVYASGTWGKKVAPAGGETIKVKFGAAILAQWDMGFTAQHSGIWIIHGYIRGQTAGGAGAGAVDASFILTWHDTDASSQNAVPSATSQPVTCNTEAAAHLEITWDWDTSADNNTATMRQCKYVAV